MTTITVDKDDDWDQHGWTSVPNALIRDETLTPDAKWAFAWLASHTKTYTFSAEGLAEAGPKGRNHARDSLRELEEHGWLTRRKIQDSQTGRVIGMAYKLHAVPVPAEQRTFVPSTAKKRKFPAQQKASSEPAPARTVAGDGGGDSDPEIPRSGPATAQPGAGGPGAGQPGTGPSVALCKEEKTTREDQEEDERAATRDRRPPVRGHASAATAPASNGAELALIPPPPGAVATTPKVTARDVASAWVDTYRASVGAEPTRHQTGQVARESKALLEAGNPANKVLYAARSVASRGKALVTAEFAELSAAARGRATARPAARRSTTDERVSQGTDLVAYYASLENEEAASR